ncbi:MAG: ATP-binding protein, partial [Mollicutes bacterium]|nr:ATP-binding protein [Mollicutes bacterium]
MLNISEIINECLTYESESEWFGIKENWFEKDQLGEYISSLSNSAAILGKQFAYMIWGVNDATHKIVGTSFDYNIDINNEPLKHYLARNLNPSIGFYFQET